MQRIRRAARYRALRRVVGSVILGGAGLCALPASIARSEWRWGTLYEPSKAGRELVLEKPWPAFLEAWQAWEKKGYRLVDFEVMDNVARYSGVFEPGTHVTSAKIGVGFDELMKAWGDWEKQGLRVDDFESWLEGGQRRYGAIFRPGSGGLATLIQDDWDEFISGWEALEEQGQRITDFETWIDAGRQRYMAAFRSATYPTASLMGVSWRTLSAELESFYADGYRVQDLEVLAPLGDEATYYALFGKTTGPDKLRSEESSRAFLGAVSELRRSGREIADIEPYWFTDEKPKPAAQAAAPPYVPIPLNDTLDSASGLSFPKSMPAVRYPDGFTGCNRGETTRIKRGWAMAHYMTWVADQAMDWMAHNGQYREDAWNYGYQTPNEGNYWANYAPRAWFGPYTKDRFQIAQHAIAELWRERFRGKTFTVKCRSNDDNKGAHPCYRINPTTGNNPAANHLVFGTINFCNNGLDGGLELKDAYADARRVVHELFHWLRTKEGLNVGDLHTHCHGGARCSTETMYGQEKATHLSHYDGGSRGFASGQARRASDHRKKALRNNDNYAFFIYHIGRMAYSRTSFEGLAPLTQFPPSGFKF